MDQNNDDKYTCPVCGSVVKNIRKNITQHNASQKHLNALNGEAPKEINATRAQRQAEYRARLKRDLGEEKFKEAQKLQKQKQRAKYKEGEEKIEEEIKDYQKEVRDQVKNIVKNINFLIKKKRDEPNKNLEEVREIEKRVEEAIPKIEMNSDCLQVVEQMYQAGKRYAESKGDLDIKIDGKRVFIKKKSIMQYHQSMHRWYLRFYGKPLVDCSDLSWIRRDMNKFAAFIMKWVKNEARDPKNFQNSLTGVMTEITGYLKRVKGYEAEYQKISELLKVTKDKREKMLKQNKPTKKQEERFISLTELRSFADTESGTSKQRLIYALYSFFVRRNMDYRFMKYYVLKPKDTLARVKSRLDDNFNYIIVSNKTREPHTFIFNNYKTEVKKKLGQQQFKIPDEIKPFIKEYVEDTNLKSGNLFFTKQKDGTPLEESSFSALISSSFKEITGIPLSNDDVRHINVNHYIGIQPALSIESLTKEAHKMGQSDPQTFYSYYKRPGGS